VSHDLNFARPPARRGANTPGTYVTHAEKLPWHVRSADGATLLAAARTEEAARRSAQQMRGPVIVVYRGKR